MSSLAEARLVMLHGPDRLERVHRLVRNAMTVGRSEAADIVIDVDSVSKKHAAFDWSAEGWRVRDLPGSCPGTHVNERAVDEHEGRLLRGGEHIRLGTVVLAFVYGDDLDATCDRLVARLDMERVRKRARSRRPGTSRVGEPPPIPFVRTASESLALREDHVVVRPVGGPMPFLWQEQASGATYAELVLPASRIAATSVGMLEDGRALVRVEGAFYRETCAGESSTERWVGPLPAAEATVIAAALDRKLGLPLEPQGVDINALERMPEAFHGMYIETTAPWFRGPELSCFAGAWLAAPPTSLPSGHLHKVIGFFWYHGPPPAGPGPLGGRGPSNAYLEAVRSVPVVGRHGC
jgi:hypothetical protein